MLEVFDCEQGSPEWFACRLGIPTASKFATVLAKGKTAGTASVGRREYLYKLAGETITGQLAESYSNGYMERGKAMEPEARAAYAFLSGNDPLPIGFARRGRAGASPDSLIGLGGVLEIKTKAPHLMIEAMFRDDAPPKHIAQIQGQLWITERDWCDLAIYYPGMPLVIHRIGRDEDFIGRIAAAVKAFNEELDEIIARVRAYGDPSALRRSLQASLDDPALLMRY